MDYAKSLQKDLHFHVKIYPGCEVVRKQLHFKPHQHLFNALRTLETIMAIIINLQQAFRRKFIRGEQYLAWYLL